MLNILYPRWWPTRGLVPTPEAPLAPSSAELKTPHDVALDNYNDLLDRDPNERYSGLSENDVEELRQIMTEMDGVEVTPEVAWSTARAVLELVRVMLESDYSSTS